MQKSFSQTGKYSDTEVYNLLTSIDFFEKEFFSLDQRTLSILKSEVSRITNIFISDYNVSKTFCPPIKDINFNGFKNALETGKIVVLNLSILNTKILQKS